MKAEAISTAGEGTFALVDLHALHIERSLDHFFCNEFEAALDNLDFALLFGNTPHARWNRALTLLALGRYREAMADLGARHDLFSNIFTDRGRRLRKELPRWQGEADAHVLLLHEGGFGDSLMLLRYVPKVRAISASVALVMPPQLERLARQLAPVDRAGCCWAGMFDLISLPIPQPPYLKIDEKLRAQWKERIGNDQRKKIGIAWSSATAQVGEHDFQRRGCELGEFLALLGAHDCSLFSLQAHGQSEGLAHGVNVFEFADFADVAALAAEMEMIISIDTAALHVAGAIGHPNINAILPYAATWRWQNGNRWYPAMNLCRQKTPGDWASAFAQVRF